MWEESLNQQPCMYISKVCLGSLIVKYRSIRLNTSACLPPGCSAGAPQSPAWKGPLEKGCSMRNFGKQDDIIFFNFWPILNLSRFCMYSLDIHQISVRCTACALFRKIFRTFRFSSSNFGIRIHKRVQIQSAPTTASCGRSRSRGRYWRQLSNRLGPHHLPRRPPSSADLGAPLEGVVELCQRHGSNCRRCRVPRRPLYS